MGVEFYRVWTSHLLSDAVLDNTVDLIRSAHKEKQFRAIFTQNSSIGVEYLAMGDKLRIPLIKMEVCEAAPNLRNHPLLNTSLVPAFLMPMLWRVSSFFMHKLLHDCDWATACERHGWPIESAAESWQRLVNSPILIGNDLAYANQSDFEAIMHNVMVTPRWGLEEVVDPLVEKNVIAFLEAHSGKVGLVCFGSMELHGEDAAKLGDFLDGCGPVIVQKGTCPLPNTAWRDVATGKSNVLFLDQHVPHAWLLPKAEWFVCHGGVGTMHAALRAQVPTIIVPFLGDQIINLSELVRRGRELCGDSSPDSRSILKYESEFK